MLYRNFDIRIRSDQRGDLWTDLVQSPFGPADASFTFPFAEGATEDPPLVRMRDVPRPEAGTAQERNVTPPGQEEEAARLSSRETGGALFKALIAGKVAEQFVKALAQVEASAGEEGLRLLLGCNPEDPNLATVAAQCWELLSAPGSEHFLAQARRTPLLRYFPMSGPPIRSRSGALRVLVVRSAPIGLPALDLAVELERLWAALQPRPDVEIAVLDHPTLEGLRSRLLREPWQILHFMGHGCFKDKTGEGMLWFETPNGEAEPIPASILGLHLRDSRDLRLVVLNACATGAVPYRAGQTPYSALPPALLRAGVPAVLAMQLPVSDRGAIAFSAKFYEQLACGDPVDAAVVEGRLAMLRLDHASLEWATPIFFTRIVDDDILGVLPPIEEGGAAAPAVLPPPWQEEPLRLGIRSFNDTGDALIFGQEMEREGAQVLDLSEYFEGANGRYIKDPALWQSPVFSKLRGFLAGPANERRPLHLNFAAHATLAFAAGYCLDAKSGLDITIRQRGMKAGDWHAASGTVPEGTLFEDQPDLPRDLNARDVAVAVGITRPVTEDVEIYLNREGVAVRRILPVTFGEGAGQARVRDGLHALALAEDLAAKIRRRTLHEHEGVLHLFISAPNALLFFLGQLARDFGPVQLYEFEFGAGKRGAYLPSLRLPVSGNAARRGAVA
jgi:hypothetical protein